MKNSLMQINSKLNSKLYDYPYELHSTQSCYHYLSSSTACVIFIHLYNACILFFSETSIKIRFVRVSIKIELTLWLHFVVTGNWTSGLSLSLLKLTRSLNLHSVTNLLLYVWVALTTGQYTCNFKVPSNIVSFNRC